MILGRFTNPPLYSVRALVTREQAVSVAGVRVLAFVVLSLAVVNLVPSRGYADEDDEEVAIAPATRQFALTEQQFDQMVFGSQRVVRVVNGVQTISSGQMPTAADFRSRMESLAVTEIQAIHKCVSFTEAQKKKLQLAIRGDIAQHVSRAEELRPKLTSKPLDQPQYADLMRQLQPLRMAQYSGIFGENSLFRKTLRHTLTPDQRRGYQLFERERQATMVNNVLVSLPNIEWGPMEELGKSDPRSRQANRQRFVEELLTHGNLPRTENLYFQHAVLLEVVRLEERLRPLVIEESWKKLQVKAIDARRFEASISFAERQASEVDEGDETKD